MWGQMFDYYAGIFGTTETARFLAMVVNCPPYRDDGTAPATHLCLLAANAALQDIPISPREYLLFQLREEAYFKKAMGRLDEILARQQQDEHQRVLSYPLAIGDQRYLQFPSVPDRRDDKWFDIATSSWVNHLATDKAFVVLTFLDLAGLTLQAAARIRQDLWERKDALTPSQPRA